MFYFVNKSQKNHSNEQTIRESRQIISMLFSHKQPLALPKASNCLLFKSIVALHGRAVDTCLCKQ